MVKAIYLTVITLLALAIVHLALGETVLSQSMPLCPLNASTVLILGTQFISPSGNMIIDYGPPGPWSIVTYGNFELLLYMDMWNLANIGYGNMTMTFNNKTGEICLSAFIGNVTLLNPSGGVWGYPTVCFDGVYPGTSLNVVNPILPLPQRVYNLIYGPYSNRFIVLNYSVWVPDDEPMDWAFDNWLTSTPAARNIGFGDAELMIWLYTNMIRLYAPEYASKAGLYGYIGVNVTVPMIINGSLTNVTFAVLVNCTYSWGWTYIAFIPVNGGYANAYINLSLKPFLTAMSNILPRACPNVWNSTSQVYELWLNDLEIGSEFGSAQWAINPGWGAAAWKLYNIEISAPAEKASMSTSMQNTNKATIPKYYIMAIIAAAVIIAVIVTVKVLRHFK